jgi:cysteinyl-tRNA synthetase
MVTRLGQLAAEGMVDRRDIVAPFVEALLDLRLAARADKRWADADAIRDVLVAAAIEIRDRPGATDWSAL